MMNKTTRFTANAATVMAIAGTVIGIMGMGLTLVACGSYDKKEEVANVTEDENTEPTIIVDDEISTGLNESDLYKSFLGLHVSSYDGSDIMVEEDGENGGRNGIALSAGFRWALGKDVSNGNLKQTNNLKPTLPKAKVELSSAK